ncbi:bacillolysin/thermolysin/neutral peptidase B [Oceanobacillus limi]|uniref:Neutral metalloproteinase n=1 Tax=Oceanobacillus limi TaxID=930131 RepID=A0A1I0ACC8_9BACI|nr:M4 family metallopeptidase [Oceanobacillus limi]SES91889.1 bacillolysin/thermolysin/neutral peptidase B [Oceanobacillus limi]
MNKKKMIPVILSSAIVASSFSAVNVLANPSDSVTPITEQSQKNWNENSNVPIFVKEKYAEKFPSSNAKNAKAYLIKNEKKLGIQNAKHNLKVKNVQKDELGMTHVRFHQTKNNIPVEGSEIIVHFNEENEVVSVNGHVNKNAETDFVATTSSVTSNEALKIAKSSVSAPVKLEYAPSSELVVYPFEGKNRLAHKINVTFLGDEPGNWFVFVDATTGEVIDKYNALLHTEGIKKKHHKGVGNGVHGDLRQIHTTLEIVQGEGASFKLYDESHDDLEGIYTYDHNTGELFENESSSWKDPYQSPAVDAHYNSESVYEYYLEEHGRNSLDDNGMAIVSYVHYGTDYNNAFWNGRHMTYGDGDGEFMVPLSAGLDVAAHEMTHGVISHTANLQYRNQSGALNESFADIFGALIDEDDWEMGEDIMAPASKEEGRTALRSLSNPSKFPVSEERAPYGNGMYPEHMDDYYDMPIWVDNGGVHVNSSITNHAAYLIGEEIGKDKLGQIYYRALTVYLTPTSNFSDARNATVQSAVDIYGENSDEVTAVENGFDQVGIH